MKIQEFIRCSIILAVVFALPRTSVADSFWPPSATPAHPWFNDLPVTLGVKFRSDVVGTVTGIRYYKGTGNNGTHIGLLYSSSGALLAQANFTGETASGWQQVTFPSPVSIAANTTYIAAYFTTSGFADDQNYFTSTGVDNGSLHALRSGVDGQNGVYAYGNAPQFPYQTWLDSNYWIDIVFTPAGSTPSSGTSVWSSSATPSIAWSNDSQPVTLGMKFRSDVSGRVTGIRFYKGVGNNGAHTALLYSATGTLLAQANFSGESASGWQQANFTSPVSIAANTTYIAAYFTTSGYAYDANYFATTGLDNAPLHALRSGADGLNGVYQYAGTPQFPSQSWVNANYWVDVAFTAGGTAPPSGASVWSNSTTPANGWVNDRPVTLGMKFRSDVSGTVTDIRFFKGAGNNGTHTALLYSSNGTLLAQANFTGETASGWQSVTFTSPVSIAANTTYIAAYFTTSGFADDMNYFTSTGIDNAPLHALRSGVDGPNSVYIYADTSQFPTQTWHDSNYWVDVVFNPGGAAPPPANGSCSGMGLGLGAPLNGYLPFPADNPWNQDISQAPIDPNSANIINYIGPNRVLHGDFEFPYVVVSGTQTKLPVTYAPGLEVASDPGPMPIPTDAPVQPASDAHVIVLDKDNCFLYELFSASYANGQWNAYSGAVWDMNINEVRPPFWPSANAAGTAEFTGLARYDEVAAGEIRHALGFTPVITRDAFTPPAGNTASTITDPNAPPMGVRLRLKASFDISTYPPQARVILQALKKYGMIAIDNGGGPDLWLAGTADARWDFPNQLYTLKSVPASAFDVVQMNGIYTPTYFPTGPAPTIQSFTASSYNIAKGQPVTLSWSISGGEYTILSPLVGAVRGTQVVVTPQSTTTYTLYSTNSHGRTMAKLTVTVQ